jgi:hypothetical protein
MIFRNNLIFHSEELLALCPTLRPLKLLIQYICSYTPLPLCIYRHASFKRVLCMEVWEDNTRLMKKIASDVF